MNARDLRIGNYAQINPAYVPKGTATGPMAITSIDETSGVIFKGDTENSYEFREIMGVTLTQALLWRSGFENDNVDGLDGYSKKGRLTIFLEEVLCKDGHTDWYTYIQFNVGMPFNHLVTNPPQYLHELQNLYFALMGREMEIIFPLGEGSGS